MARIFGLPETKNLRHSTGISLFGDITDSVDYRVFGTEPPPQKTSAIPLSEIPAERGVFSPTVSVIVGRRDAGKSYFMTLIAQAMKARLERYTGRPVKFASNYYLKVNGQEADYMYQRIVDDLIQYPPWARDMVLCIDELQTLALSRRSMSGRNVNLGEFLTEIRKRQVDIIGTTQRPQRLDQMLLEQVDYYIDVDTSYRICPYGERCAAKHIPSHIHQIVAYITDFWGTKTGRYREYKLPVPRWAADRVWRIWVKNPMKIYSAYDSYQVIASSYMDQEIRDSLIEHEQEMRGFVEKPAEVNHDSDAQIHETFIPDINQEIIKDGTPISMLKGMYGWRSNKTARDELSLMGYETYKDGKTEKVRAKQ